MNTLLEVRPGLVHAYESIGEAEAKQSESGGEIYIPLATARRLIGLVRELDIELDGVRIPATAASCVNAIRPIIGGER